MMVLATGLATGLERAPYTPFTDPRQSRAPGLMPLDPAEWFVIHEDFAGQMAYREELLATKRDVVLALLPEGRAAAEELLEAVLESIAGLPGYRFGDGAVTRPDGGEVALDAFDPLETAGRLVADDFCLLLPDAASGEYRLVGAVLCFPSRWLLTEKMGRPLTVIHDPVPDYDGVLARRVNRVFEALRVGRPLWRVNWIVHGTAELHLPLSADAEHGTKDQSKRGLYLRTERQTLLRLPRTGAVVFGIKTSVSPIDTLSPDEAQALREAMLGYDPATVEYKSGNADYRDALARLAEIACQEGAKSAS
jgi:hypothetical protein